MDPKTLGSIEPCEDNHVPYFMLERWCFAVNGRGVVLWADGVGLAPSRTSREKEPLDMSELRFDPRPRHSLSSSLGVAAALFVFAVVRASVALPGPIHGDAATTSGSTLTAEAIVERAIESQGARDLRDRLEDFSLFAAVRASFDGHETDTDIRQFYKAEQKFRMETKTSFSESESWQVKVYDGAQDLAWEQAEGRVRLHRGRSGHQDKEKIKSNLTELKRLLRYFFLSNLPGPGVTFEKLEDAEKDGIRAFVIERRVSEEVRKKAANVEFAQIRLFIEKESYRLVGVEIPPEVTAERKRLNVCFDGRVSNVLLNGKPAAESLWIPKFIRVFENDRRQSESQLLEVKINSGIEDEQFAPPSRR